MDDNTGERFDDCLADECYGRERSSVANPQSQPMREPFDKTPTVQAMEEKGYSFAWDAENGYWEDGPSSDTWMITFTHDDKFGIVMDLSTSEKMEESVYVMFDWFVANEVQHTAEWNWVSGVLDKSMESGENISQCMDNLSCDTFLAETSQVTKLGLVCWRE